MTDYGPICGLVLRRSVFASTKTTTTYYKTTTVVFWTDTLLMQQLHFCNILCVMECSAEPVSQIGGDVSLICECMLIDEDECASGGRCVNGQCINTDGGYRCVCAIGYHLNVDATDCEGRVHQVLAVSNLS